MHHSNGGHLAIRDGQWKLNLCQGSGVSFTPLATPLKKGESPFELYDMKSDWRETANVASKHPDVVERLKEMATRIVREGRSTPGAAQLNDGPQLWAELIWIPEAAKLPKPKRKGNDDDQ